MIENFSKEELNNEQWKAIDGYDGLYEVSSLGRVRSFKFGKTRVLRPVNNSCGYLQVGLCKRQQNKTKRFLVHRLVAQAFIDNDDSGKNEINHINEDKTDNRVYNLEWCDRSYNNSYNGLQKRRYHKKHKIDKIKYLYNPNLSIKQNIEIFRANGIECSTVTLWKLRKDLGLINQ